MCVYMYVWGRGCVGGVCMCVRAENSCVCVVEGRASVFVYLAVIINNFDLTAAYSVGFVPL